MIESIVMPKHWQIKKLRGVCKDLQSGKRPKGGVQGIETGIPSIGAEHLNYNGGFKFEKIKFVPQDFATKMSKGIISMNDIIVVKDGATTGKTSFVGNDFPFEHAVINEHVFILRLKEEVLPKFAFYKLFSATGNKEILEDFRGAAQGGISSGFLDKVNIPLPPLPEQQSIVSKIEELFSDLENGKQQLQLAQQQLKVYRQSLLNTTVMGKNVKSIESVIEKLDQGWSPRCLNEGSKDNDEWAVIKTTAVQHGHFVPIENKILPSGLKPRVQHELKVGDILITRAGPRIRVGVCCMVRSTRPKLINCDKVYRIKVNVKIIKPEYFELILNTPYYLSEIEKMKSGISDSGLNLTQSKFLKIEIPIPSIEEQLFIINELECKLTVCDKIEETVSQSLQLAETLRQSILKKAFEGKLI